MHLFGSIAFFLFTLLSQFNSAFDSDLDTIEWTTRVVRSLQPELRKDSDELLARVAKARDTLESLFGSAADVVSGEKLEAKGLTKAVTEFVSFSRTVEELRDALSNLLAKQERITGTPPVPPPQVKMLRVGRFKGLLETIQRLASGHGIEKV